MFVFVTFEVPNTFLLIKVLIFVIRLLISGKDKLGSVWGQGQRGE